MKTQRIEADIQDKVLPELFGYTPDESDTLIVSGDVPETSMDIPKGLKASPIDIATFHARKHIGKAGTYIVKVESHNVGEFGKIEFHIAR